MTTKEAIESYEAEISALKDNLSVTQGMLKGSREDVDRLKAVNAELVKALEKWIQPNGCTGDCLKSSFNGNVHGKNCIQARAALKLAQEVKP